MALRIPRVGADGRGLRPARRARRARDRRRHRERAAPLGAARRPPLHATGSRVLGARHADQQHRRRALGLDAGGRRPAVSLRNERGAALTASSADGTAAGPRARASALDPLSHVAGARRRRRRPANARCARAVAGHLGLHARPAARRRSPTTPIAAARAHFLTNVTAGGPLPALRLGRQPYGVLAATSLAQWRLLDPPDLDAQLVPLLSALIPAWRAALAERPARDARRRPRRRARRRAVAMSPVSVHYARARRHAARPPTSRRSRGSRRRCAPIRALGLALEPALARAVFDPAATALTGPAGRRTQPSETARRRRASISSLAGHNGLDARAHRHAAGGANTLLFALLRHALLREYAHRRAADRRAPAGSRRAGEGDEPGLGRRLPRHRGRGSRRRWTASPPPGRRSAGTSTPCARPTAARARPRRRSSPS